MRGRDEKGEGRDDVMYRLRFLRANKKFWDDRVEGRGDKIR